MTFVPLSTVSLLRPDIVSDFATQLRSIAKNLSCLSDIVVHVTGRTSPWDIDHHPEARRAASQPAQSESAATTGFWYRGA
jgi:hypothetical protein